MKAVLATRDFGPSEALEKVGNALRSGGKDTWCFFGYGKDLPPIGHALADNVDVALIGISSSPESAREEIVVAESAAANDIPFGFYSDIHHCYRRPWFRPLRGRAAFLFVLTEHEAREARDLFPNAKVFVSGSPPLEEYFFPNRSREEARSKAGVAPSQKMIFCPLNTNFASSLTCASGVIEAANRLGMRPKDWLVVLKTHPGASEPAASYKDLARYSRVPVRIIEGDGGAGITNLDLVTACDVAAVAFSTVGAGAACQRKPLISYFTEITCGRMEAVNGYRNWLPAELGAARVARDYGELADSILNLTRYQDERNRLAERQENLYPRPPEKGHAARTIASTLTSFL